MTMRKRAVAFAAMLGVLGIALIQVQSWGTAPSEHKVTLCHATHSFTNPYVEITVDFHSITKGGHGSHDGPVFFAGIDKHTHWGDIIPAFDFGPGAQYAGKNLDAGRVILENGCSVEEPTTTSAPETTSTTAEPTTTVPETTSTTAEPTTTVPETTTTIEPN
jgi:hypothetical protein